MQVPALYNVGEKSMETITVESIPIVVGLEEDGRWWADIESMPGVMAYGAARESAIIPYSACFWGRVRVMRGLGARSATFCHYNRRRVRIGSAPREASDPDGPSELAVGAGQYAASAGPTLLRIWEY